MRLALLAIVASIVLAEPAEAALRDVPQQVTHGKRVGATNFYASHDEYSEQRQCAEECTVRVDVFRGPLRVWRESVNVLSQEWADDCVGCGSPDERLRYRWSCRRPGAFEYRITASVAMNPWDDYDPALEYDPDGDGDVDPVPPPHVERG